MCMVDNPWSPDFLGGGPLDPVRAGRDVPSAGGLKPPARAGAYRSPGPGVPGLSACRR